MRPNQWQWTSARKDLAAALSDLGYPEELADLALVAVVFRRLFVEEQRDDELEWLRASASMPLASKIVNVGGRQLLDGGVSDSIPLEYFERQGYQRNVVILTQPKGYQKEHNRLMPLMRVALRKYPQMIKAMDERHLMYNRQLDYVAKAEQEGRCLVIRPEEKLPIGHISHDPDEMQRVYDIGRAAGEKHLAAIRRFLAKDGNHL